MPALGDQVRRMVGIELSEISGTLLAGEVPLRNALVNRLIARRLATAQLPIEGVRIEPHEGGRLTIVLSMRGSIMPDIKIEAQIEQQPEFPSPAVLGLRWTMPGMGRLSLLAGPALSYFKKLPPGIRMDGDRIEVAIPELLRWRGMGELMDYITRLHITTREGAIIAAFALRVP
jgi:hypothetical protein